MSPEDLERITAMRLWPVDRKARYLNALRKAVAHRCPKNNQGVPLVSDFDLITADDDEIGMALKSIES